MLRELVVPARLRVSKRSVVRRDDPACGHRATYLPYWKVVDILSSMENENSVEEILTAAISGRAWLAQRLVAPWWYHPCLGLLAGALTAVGIARNGTFFAWAVVGYSIGCGLVMWANQRRVGVSMRYFDRAMSSVFVAQVLCMALVAAVGCWLEFSRNLRGALLVAALCEFGITVLFGYWCDRVLRQRIVSLQ